jgi:protein-disulfide isomerase
MASSEPVAEGLTRKQRRDAARAHHEALEKAQASRTLRRRRLTQLAIVVAIVATGFIAAIVSTNGTGETVPGSPAAKNTERAVNATVGGISQKGNALGSPTAPVTLRYFGDLECVVCQEFALGALPSLIQRWVRSGKLRIEYRSLQTATREPEVFDSQQIAALAAGEQQKLWQYVETFYREQGLEGSGYVSNSYLENIARQVTGLNLAQWTETRANTALVSQLSADAHAASAVGFTGTPSFLLGRTGKTMRTFTYTSLTDPTSFNEAIEHLIQG